MCNNQFFKRNRLEMVLDMLQASKYAHRRRQRRPGRVPQVGTSYLKKTHMSHVLYPIFQEKSVEIGLRYVRGLKVMLIDVDNVNQAESHSGYVIF